jgi:hypothetical protein
MSVIGFDLQVKICGAAKSCLLVQRIFGLMICYLSSQRGISIDKFISGVFYFKLLLGIYYKNISTLIVWPF